MEVIQLKKKNVKKRYYDSQIGGWMDMPNRIANCPFGLEYLASVDQLLVHQVIEMLEALTGYETNNKYEIKNSFGQKVRIFLLKNWFCVTFLTL